MRGLLGIFEAIAWALWLARELTGWLAWCLEAILTLVRLD